MLKTLVKIAKGRSTIPVLNTIRIKDNVATATDLDNYIHVPVTGYSHADGDEDLTYHAHGFDKGMVFKSEIPATDFPDMNQKGRVCGAAEFNAAQIEALRWVLLAASKEETRYYLNGIHFEAGHVVATDGHRLHSFQHDVRFGLEETDKPKKKPAAKGKKKKAEEPAPERTPIKSAILPRAASNFILDMVKETKAASFSIEFHDTLHYTCRIPGGIVIDGKLIDGTFPDWRRVVPQHDEKNKTVFDPAQIKAIKPKLEVLAKVAGTYHSRLAIGTTKGSAWLSTSNPKDAQQFPIIMQLPFTAGFNVKYLTEMCGGMMEYGDSTTPFKVIDKRGGVERMGVLMPLRI